LAGFEAALALKQFALDAQHSTSTTMLREF